MKATITNLNPVEVTYPVKPEIGTFVNRLFHTKDETNEYLEKIEVWQSTKKTARMVNVETANNGTPYIEFVDDYDDLVPIEAELGMTVEFEPETRMITKI